MVEMRRKFVVFISLVFLMSACGKDECSCSDSIYNTWEVVDFVSKESVLYEKTDGNNPTIEFKSEGGCAIRLDINSCFGDFELSGENNISISTIGCTEACCDSDFSSKFISMLSQVKTYTFYEDQLKLNVPAWGWIELELQ